MGYAIDQDYRGTIAGAALVESSSGNSGFRLTLDGAAGEGAISHTIWVTERSRDMAVKQLKACGLSEAQMGSDELWSNPASLLVGAEVAWRTKEEVDREGRAWTRVAYILSGDKAAGDEARRKGRALLAGKKDDAPYTNAHGAEITDDDVPFF